MGRGLLRGTKGLPFIPDESIKSYFESFEGDVGVGDEGDGQSRGETDPARAITVPPFPSGEVATEAAADDQSSSSAAQTLAAKRQTQRRNGRVGSCGSGFPWIVTGLVVLWMVAIYASAAVPGDEVDVWAQLSVVGQGDAGGRWER